MPATLALEAPGDQLNDFVKLVDRRYPGDQLNDFVELVDWLLVWHASVFRAVKRFLFLNGLFYIFLLLDQDGSFSVNIQGTCEQPSWLQHA